MNAACPPNWAMPASNEPRVRVLVKKNTRLPEPAATVAYTDIARLERDTGNGVNIAKAIAIGLASGTGVVVGLILFAMQLD